MPQEKGEGSVFLWEKDQVIPLLTSLKLAPGSAEHAQCVNAPSSSYSEDHNPSGIPLYQPSYPSSQKNLKCSLCNSVFESREEQVEHYKSDWHLFNLKRSLKGANSVSLSQFQLGVWGDEGDIKGEDSSEEDDDEDEDEVQEEENEFSDEENIAIKKKPRVFFINADQQLISIYRTVLQHKNAEAASETDYIHRTTAAPRKLYWIIILVGGGHFAGAVYKGFEVLVHKAFHSYTIRAKQGGTQTARDNKNATSHPRSAGSMLRRYNEQHFIQHVQDIVEGWSEHIAKCDLIFCRCPKRNYQILYGGQNPFLSRGDQRIRTIPFPTKKPTYLEIKRVHRSLAEIIVHGKIKNLLDLENEKEETPKILPQKSSENKEQRKVIFKKPTKGDLADVDTRLLSTAESSSNEDGDVYELTTSFETLSTHELNPYYNSMEKQIKKRKEKRKKKKNKMNHNNSEPEMNENEDLEKNSLYDKRRRSLENFLYSSCRAGDLTNLREFAKFLDLKAINQVMNTSEIPEDVVDFLSETEEDFDWKSVKFGTNEKSLLHVASENGHKNLIWWLLEKGCDPCLKNNKNETPYLATKVKESKQQFRRFMAAFPNKYDYKLAGIPSPLTTEQELQQKSKLAEKKKQQKKAREEREKLQKKEQEKAQKEREERENFLKLSDREKRALAAEKRILESKQQNSVFRCVQCGEDLSSVVPFEYCDFKFCSTKCVREHRAKNKPL